MVRDFFHRKIASCGRVGKTRPFTAVRVNSPLLSCPLFSYCVFCFCLPDPSVTSYAESSSSANARSQFSQVPKMLKMVEQVKGAFKGMKKIPKATVFGIHFSVAAQDSVDGIPMLIKRCVTEIDNRGLTVKVFFNSIGFFPMFWSSKIVISGNLSCERCEKSHREDMLFTRFTAMCSCRFVGALSSRYKRRSQILPASITRAAGPSRFLCAFYSGRKGNIFRSSGRNITRLLGWAFSSW